MRFFFYSHDGLGLGHTRRNVAVAAALTELAPEADVLLACGIEEVAHMGLPENVATLKLPSLRKAGNGSYAARQLRIPPSDIRTLRSSVLSAAIKAYRPDVVLVDKHPFGACGEFREGLEELREAGGRSVLGLRDILDDRQAVDHEWGKHDLLALIPNYYDRVLVYGHPTVFNPITEYGFPPAVAKKSYFCGYVVNREDGQPYLDLPRDTLMLTNGSRPVVLATAGGGEDGFSLLEKFIRASIAASWQATVITGPMTSNHDYKALAHLAAEANVTIGRFVPNLSSLFSSADALVCMGGYNTLAEASCRGTPTVCVPRISPRAEQRMRAAAFEKLGLVKTLAPEELTVDALRAQINSVLGIARKTFADRAHAILRFDGAKEAANHLLAVAAVVAAPASAQLSG